MSNEKPSGHDGAINRAITDTGSGNPPANTTNWTPQQADIYKTTYENLQRQQQKN